MFKDLYKQNGVEEAEERQENRRRELLLEQKQRRTEFQDENRPNLVEVFTKQKQHKHYTHTFKDVCGADLGLQMSEWMRERPIDICDWLLVPCPVGQRCLVVAHDGRTEMYNKTGRRCFGFKSILPGGERNTRKDTTILDCVYAREVERIYVLDVLAFGNQQFVNCDAQFRFFWLQSKFEEHDQLGQRSSRNEKPMLLLRPYDFEYAQQVAVAFQSYPLWPKNKPKLDGFLFYHKEASYSCGCTTPLVVWLFAFMVPDMLNMDVSSEYSRPDDYENPEQYMKLFDARLAEKRTSNKNRNRSTCSAMDITTEETTMEESTLENILESERMLELEGFH